MAKRHYRRRVSNRHSRRKRPYKPIKETNHTDMNQGFDNSPEAEKRRLIAELDETDSKLGRKRILDEIFALDAIINQNKKPEQREAIKRPSRPESNDLETVREKLGIDLNDKSHIRPKENRYVSRDVNIPKSTIEGATRPFPNRNVNTNNSYRKSNKNKYILIIAIVIIAIIGYLFYESYGNAINGNLSQNSSGMEGTQTHPYQPNANDTITWQGPGYYLIPQNIPATGLEQGIDLLSVQSQVSGYNQWITTTSTVSTSSTSTTTISQTELDAGWATELFNNISTVRGEQYSYCSNLSQFAQVRFNTMSTGNNYTVSHWGYDQNFDEFYGGVYNTYFAEEVFYPNIGLGGDTPNSYMNQIQTTAPLHWQLLVDDNYSYYGYYIQTGPTYVIYGPDGGYAVCPVTEIPGPNINISQFFAQYGCTVQESTETWLVIEIASACP